MKIAVVKYIDTAIIGFNWYGHIIDESFICEFINDMPVNENYGEKIFLIPIHNN